MCHSLPTMLALFVLLAMAIYTGVTVNFLGKRFGDWRFSWSYILGWVALLMTFFAGLFKLNCSRVQCHCVAIIKQNNIHSYYKLRAAANIQNSYNS